MRWSARHPGLPDLAAGVAAESSKPQFGHSREMRRKAEWLPFMSGWSQVKRPLSKPERVL